MRKTTLCYIEKDNCYLMLHRTRKKADGSFEKWLGVGGKLEENETPEECVLREVYEETGYTLINYCLRATIFFYSDTFEDEIMYLYTATDFTGEETLCDEGELVWIKKSEVPNLKIWEGDRLFLQKIAKDSPYFELELHYKGHSLESYKWIDPKNDINNNGINNNDINENAAKEIYPQKDVCSICKGMCCKSNGCSLSPEDFTKKLNGLTPDYNNFLNVLKNNPFAIDSFYYEGQQTFFVRMRHKCFTFIGVDAMGECQALTDTGCSLSYDERPKGGRYLEAIGPGQCFQHYQAKEMKKDWAPYQEILQSIWNKYEPLFSSDGTFDRCEEEYMAFQKSRRNT